MATCPGNSAAPPLARRNGVPKIMLAFGTLAVFAGLALFRTFDPSQHGFFPRCTFHALTGLDCPGCGVQRAVYHLLHGELAAALHANALLITLLPVGIWLLLRFVVLRFAGFSLPAVFQNRTGLCLLFAAVVLFGILRNLPSCEWLRP